MTAEHSVTERLFEAEYELRAAAQAFSADTSTKNRARLRDAARAYGDLANAIDGYASEFDAGRTEKT